MVKSYQKKISIFHDKTRILLHKYSFLDSSTLPLFIFFDKTPKKARILGIFQKSPLFPLLSPLSFYATPEAKAVIPPKTTTSYLPLPIKPCRINFAALFIRSACEFFLKSYNFAQTFRKMRYLGADPQAFRLFSEKPLFLRNIGIHQLPHSFQRSIPIFLHKKSTSSLCTSKSRYFFLYYCNEFIALVLSAYIPSAATIDCKYAACIFIRSSLPSAFWSTAIFKWSVTL